MKKKTSTDQFEKSQFCELSAKERIEQLNANCDKAIPSYKYYRELTSFEKEQNNEDVIQGIAAVNRLKEDRKELNKKIAVHGKGIAKAHEDLITGQTEVTEDVFEVANMGTGYMETINRDGLIIEKRFMKGGVQMTLSSAKNKEESV